MFQQFNFVFSVQDLESDPVYMFLEGGVSGEPKRRCIRKVPGGKTDRYDRSRGYLRRECCFKTLKDREEAGRAGSGRTRLYRQVCLHGGESFDNTVGRDSEYSGGRCGPGENIGINGKMYLGDEAGVMWSGIDSLFPVFVWRASKDSLKAVCKITL